jgi:hypothetical protein
MFKSRLVAIHCKHLHKKCQQLCSYGVFGCNLTEKYDYAYNLIVAKLNSWQKQFEQHLACIKIIPPGYFLNLF